MPNQEIEILDDHQAKIVVTVDPERLEKEKRAAARRIAKKVNIPGFRKGKAPYHIIVQHYGEAAILDEAIDPLGQAVYTEALDEGQIEPYAPGILSDLSLDPPIFTFMVPLIPEVNLGSYREVRVDYDPPEVLDADIDEVLKRLQDQYATFDPIQSSIEFGKYALLDIVGKLVRPEDSNNDLEPSSDPNEAGNNIWVNRKGIRIKIDEDSTYPVPGFSKQLVGMTADEQRSFTMSFIADDEGVAEALRGKTVSFEVNCLEVYEHNLPELDDGFASEVDSDYQTLEDLRSDVRKQLVDEAEQTARTTYTDRIFDVLISDYATLKYPPVMVDEQIDHMLEDMESNLQRQGINLDDYLKITGKDKDALREEYREHAEKQLAKALILSELVMAEGLSITDEEIEDEISTAVLPFGSQAQLMRQFLSSKEARRDLANRLLTDKGITRMIKIARGENPEIGEEKAPEQEGEPESSVSETHTTDSLVEENPADTPEVSDAASGQEESPNPTTEI